uniref:Sulfatase N-terminal domain-containing protein n=1 Tax=Strigamia maritima TaxID=126957 RepID=T1JA64_STRMM
MLNARVPYTNAADAARNTSQVDSTSVHPPPTAARNHRTRAMFEGRSRLCFSSVALIFLLSTSVCTTRKVTSSSSRDVLRTPPSSTFRGGSSVVTSTSTTTRRQFRVNKKPIFQREKKPNIILILTDDQDIELGSMNAMPKALHILRDGGVHFPNAYVTTPMCCPSRSSILTGMYVHNHNVFTNNDNCSSPYWQQNHETRSFATYLNNAGYRTGYIGKYLNEYNGTYIPPGWREWAGLIRNSRFYNYSINLNGMKVKHGDDYNMDYYSDLITNDSLAFLRQSKQYFGNKPVLLVASYPAPHGPEDAAPQYQNMFFNNTSHRTPNWNYAPNQDKQWILRYTGKMEPIHIKFTDMLHTKRLQTLQSVDDALERIYNELKLLGELDNTYIIYTSDHGYHLGQFGLVKGKAMPFEFDIKVPFYLRGPKIPKGISIPNIVLNLDIAPTILDLAGVEVPPHMDGKSIKKLLIDANEITGRSSKRLNRRYPTQIRIIKPWRDTFLIESSGRRTIAGHDRWNLWREHHESRPLDTMTKDQRLSVLCKRPEYEAPCQPGQKWECTHDGFRWRIHKCRLQSVNDRHKTNCVCPNQGLDVAEKNAQKAFIKGHVNRKDFKPRFINSRQQRSTDHVLDDLLDEDIEQLSRENVYSSNFDLSGVFQLHDILLAMDKEAELEDVSFKSKQLAFKIFNGSSTPVLNLSDLMTLKSQVVHKITERSLKKLPYLKSLDCQVLNGTAVNCSSTIYKDVNVWRENKDYVDDQIKELKTKLEQLKGIRKHLKHKKPWDKQYKTIPALQDLDQDQVSDNEDSSVSKSEESINEDNPDTRTKLNHCVCAPPFGKSRKRNHRDELQEEKRRFKEERIKHKERDKTRRKKAKYLNTTCNAEKMNCFTHDNNHWKTAPLWTYGPFCFCQNANNNTYWCLRTLNETHNFLFCEFMQNIIHDIPLEILHQLHVQLMKMRECQGNKQCTVQSARKASVGVDDETYNLDIAAARISKHTTK